MTELWSEDPRTALRVGADFDLSTFDRGGTPAWTGTKDQAADAMKARGGLLSELQELYDPLTHPDNWVEDTAPGDTKGQAVNDVWWVLDPAGDAVGAS